MGDWLEAQSRNDEDDWKTSTYVIYLENDDLSPDWGDDENYTNGWRFTLNKNHTMLNFEKIAGIFGEVPEDCSERSDSADPDSVCVGTSFHVGQQFYTPDDITQIELIANDRPYAGWLYGGGTWNVSSDFRSIQTDVHLGITGRFSGGEWLQTKWHSKKDIDVPQGWGNQIGGRLGIVVGHSRHWAKDWDSSKGRWLEVVRYAGFTSGNIIDDVYGGARVKIGYNISREWLQTGIGPRIPPRDGAGNCEIYLVLDGQARAVGYNAFLDSDQHALNMEHLVADGGGGIGVRIGPVRASYRVAFVSAEHTLAGLHDYKALRFSFTW